MLVQLNLKNFSLAKSTELHLQSGFTVLTGDTGAGKSLLIQALSVVVGGRADAGFVRIGEDKSEVSAVFDINNPIITHWLNDKEIDLDDSLIIRRVISKEGRSKAFINGVSVTVGDLKQLGDLLVHIHSQHSQQELLTEPFARQWLDKAAGLVEQADELAGHYHAWQHRLSEYKQMQRNKTQANERLDWLQFAIEETLPYAELDYHALEQEYDELSQFETLMSKANQLLQGLDDEEQNVVSLVSSIQKKSQQGVSHALFDHVESYLGAAHAQLEEAVFELRRFTEKTMFDSERYAYLDETLANIHRLARKYRIEASDLAATIKRWNQELTQLGLSIDDVYLKEQVEQHEQQYRVAAQALEQQRQQSLPAIINTLTTQVRSLSLQEAVFEMNIEDTPSPMSFGIYDYQLHFSANKGIPPALLAKVASGGELSRIALVMHTLSAKHQPYHPVLVFDEIDVGISGGTAEVVGQLLAENARQQQIIAITHQPQVAAQGHHHILVEKQQSDPASSHLRILTEEERIEAIAKMSGGVELSEEALAHAKRLRQAALNNSQSLHH